ncbi:MAG: Mevalonate kinase [Candidatus Woesebacteria bacterium GW2011_GWD1_41_12]|uniref:Mevalonate kinase n=3 Tax=Candidatus Woeseibacteriota TaxID=1752722 RepID=A0A0G0Z2F7_9BACT|nr:MAG: Mevalonate kinase [Candidatus Woesebacteria bacterium GW2011_GWD1_41_12]KKS05523.1 MAG: Mevalonate kinase [Candidatus Woesebacteria bacterium GW2011_GWE1_41_24]KKS16166.1 MAG: Mevalonate kinase [Candidatus Woesebacteria bacterium GW2011_GWA1_41_7]
MKKSNVLVSAPGKLMLFGEHAVLYGNPCIVTAVDQRVYVNVEKVGGESIKINAPELKIDNYSIKVSDLGGVDYPKEVKFVLKAIEVFFKKYKIVSGLKIDTKSDFSSLFGFGSSSAVTVCMVKALSKIFDIEVDNKSLFDICFKVVLEVQGVGSGFDIAAAVWGGTIYFVRGGKVIKPLKISRLPLVVGYTGIKADTTTLVQKVAKLYKSHEKKIGEIFASIRVIVEKAKIALENTDYLKLGELMDENQKLLEDLSISSIELGSLTKAARRAGALGAKLSGAGGGDCMVALANKSKTAKIREAIEKSGGVIIDVKFNTEGVRIEK